MLGFRPVGWFLREKGVYTSYTPRAGLKVGQVIKGPALLSETVATSYIAPGWRCTLLAEGHLVLDKAP